MEKLFVFLIFYVLASSAQSAVITFDSHVAGTLVSGTPSPDSVVTDDYRDSGILFGLPGFSAGVGVVSHSQTHSGPNGVCGLDVGGSITPSCTGDIYFSFVDGLNNATTNSVSFYIGDAGGDIDGWIVNVFDLADNLLESRSVESQSIVSQTFEHTGMHRFNIDWTDITPFGYFLDDISFNEPISIRDIKREATDVSEPSSMALLFFGLSGIVLFRRRNNLQ